MQTDQNGQVVDIDDDDIVQAVQARIDRRRARIDELEGELAEHRAQAKRDERVVALLRGEASQPGPKPAAKVRRGGAQVGGTKVGAELMTAIEASIRQYAVDHEEFRQVDIRKMANPPTTSTGALATAFEVLRQDNVIRFVRQDGIAKWFRLTPTAAAVETT